MNKKNWIIAGLLGLSVSAQASLYSYTWTVGQAIPDANPSGSANNQTISDLDQGNAAFPVNPYIASVADVRINLSGGWNGDLVAYLRYDSGSGIGYTTLLNRVGDLPVSGVYTTSGMNVTLTAGQGDPDIHNTIPTTGSYNVDSTGSSTSFSSFQGLNPTTGTWSLYFADLSGSHVTTLDSWGLDLNVVPEPINVALGIFAGFFALVALLRSGWLKSMILTLKNRRHDASR